MNSGIINITMATSSVLVCLLFFVGASAAVGTNSTCVGNSTCINNEMCGDNGCYCPSNFYGDKCQFSVVNALVIVLICLLPPVSWAVVCCYGWHAKNVSKRMRHARQAGGSSSSNTNEARPAVQQEVIDDHPPPSYTEVIESDASGVYACMELSVMTPGQPADSGDSLTERGDVPSEVEPPPSYDEWLQKAASLSEQEANAREGNVRITTISEPVRFTLPNNTDPVMTFDLGVDNPACSIRDEETC